MKKKESIISSRPAIFYKEILQVYLPDLQHLVIVSIDQPCYLKPLQANYNTRTYIKTNNPKITSQRSRNRSKVLSFVATGSSSNGF